MKFKFNPRREIKIVAALLVLFVLIAFTERMKKEVRVAEIRISIENIHENHYLDEKDVLRLMRLNTENLRGANMSQLNFSEIEARIRQSPYVDNAELYSDLKGNIMVTVSLRRPLARIIQSDGPDAYIGEDGTIMPVSERFYSRVVLVSGDFVPSFLKVRNVNEIEEGKRLMDMLEMIHQDAFWNAQVAQIDINNKGKAVLYPQVGDETIEFGKPLELEKKFRKLKIFYKEILPRVGWNKYERINVEYEGQVVAE
jgi:cell division protein FtsQ